MFEINIKQKFKILLIVIVVAASVSYWELVTASSLRSTVLDGQSQDVNRMKENLKQCVILLYYKPFNKRRERPISPQLCGFDEMCLVTYNRVYFEVADAVIFHHNEVMNSSFVPTRRFAKQLYIWWCQERRSYRDLSTLNDVFNMTMTYRTDSDIISGYFSFGRLIRSIKSIKQESFKEIFSRKQKGKYAISIISNCACLKRLQLVSRLHKAGVNTTRVGKCFDREGYLSNEGKERLYEEIKNYKFYFAFENSFHCKDYITEKFWKNALFSGTVPVVWGPTKEDVLKVAPFHSFIHVDDYQTTEDLAEYLKYLINNDTAYEQYFKWRKDINNNFKENGTVPCSHGPWTCELCKLLNNEKEKDKKSLKRDEFVVPSIAKYWNGGENKECTKTPNCL